MPKTIGSFSTVKFNDHMLAIYENDKHNTVPIQRAIVAPGQGMATPKLHNPFSVSSQTKEPDPSGSSIENAGDHFTGTGSKDTLLQ